MELLRQAAELVRSIHNAVTLKGASRMLLEISMEPKRVARIQAKTS